MLVVVIVFFITLLCSYVSSITLLGHPVEIYLFGTQLMVVLICYIPLTWSLMYLYVPFYFNLQLTSVYEVIQKLVLLLLIGGRSIGFSIHKYKYCLF
jgi:hypothetical protein